MPARARPANTFSVAHRNDRLVLYRDCRFQASHVEPAPLVLRFLAELNRAAVAASPFFAVHAAVVGDDRRILVIAADSGGGKSTLAGAFVHLGLRYGSDEALCLDDQGFVVPYPKPINLNRWSWERLGLSPTDGFEQESPYPPAAFRAELLEKGRRPSDLLLPSFVDGEPSIEPLAPSSAVTALLQLSFNHYHDGPRAFRLSTEAAQHMRVWKLGVGDPAATAKLVTSTLP